MPTVTRDFTVATFVVHAGSVLLLLHRKLGMWLPPGGHIEPGELPDEAALREVLEEAGLPARLVPEPSVHVPGPRPLARPEGIQLERIAADHEHIDLIYFAVPVGDAAISGNADEGEHAGWYGLDALTGMGVTAEVRSWAARAVAAIRQRLGT